MRKKLLAVLMAVAMVVTFIPTFAFATGEVKDGPNNNEALEKVGSSSACIFVLDENEGFEYVYNDGSTYNTVPGLSYDEYQNELKLNNYNGNAIHIEEMGDIVIRLEGENYICTTGDEPSGIAILNYESEGATPTTVFWGDGKLKIKSAAKTKYAYGISSEGANLGFYCDEGGIDIYTKASGKTGLTEIGINANVSSYASEGKEVTVNICCPMDISCYHSNSYNANVAAVFATGWSTETDYYDEYGNWVDGDSEEESSGTIHIGNNYKVAKYHKTSKAYKPVSFSYKYIDSRYDTSADKREIDKLYSNASVLGASGASGKYYSKRVYKKKALDKKPDYYSTKFKFNSKVATKLSIVPNASVADMYNIAFDDSDLTYDDGNPLTTYVDIESMNEGSDYTVEYQNNVNVGLAKVILRGVGCYTGTKTYTFKILPKGTPITDIIPGNKSITVEWEPQLEKMAESTITGYVIKYSTSESMSGAKKVTVKGASKDSVTIKKLKAHKNYYVQIMTYKKVGKKTYYSTPGQVEEAFTN